MNYIYRKSAKEFFGALVLMLALGASPAFAQAQDSPEGNFDFNQFQGGGSESTTGESLDQLNGGPALEGDYQLTPEELQELQKLYGAQGDGGLQDYTTGTGFDQYGASPSPYESPYGSSGLGPSSLFLPLLLGGLGGADSGKSFLVFIGIYLVLLLLVAALFFMAAFKRYKRFSREHALVFGWNTMKKHIWLFVLLSIVQMLVWAVFGLLAYFAFRFGPEAPSIGWIVSSVVAFLVAVFFFLLFSVGLTRVSLKAHDGKPFGIGDLFNGVGLVFKYFLTSVLNFLIVVGPFIVLQIVVGVLKDVFPETVLLIGGLVAALLLAIPVSILLMKFFLSGIVVVDKGVWPITALKLSSQYTARAKTDVALFNILLLGINLIGFNVPLMLGLFVTLPVTYLAYAHMYRQLEKG